MNCYLRTFQYKRSRKNGNEFSFISILITLRSRGTHSEFQFSERYNGISFSATLADKARCCRMKNIQYLHGDKYWDCDVITLTDAEEDLLFVEACKMSDVGVDEAKTFAFSKNISEIFCGDKAIQYDTLGVTISHIVRARVWKPDDLKVWCCEAVALLIVSIKRYDFIDEPLYMGKCDETTPDILQHNVQKYCK